jgi:hypothetical protein
MSHQGLWFAINRHVPTGPGQRNRLIGQLAWRIREELPEADATAERLDSIVRAWLHFAREAATTKDYATNRQDFMRAWNNWRPPDGEPFMVRALAISQADPGVYSPDPEANAIARLMRAMSTVAGGTFTLGCRQVEQWLGISYATAHRKMKALEQAGIVRLVERGQPGIGSRKANRYEWIGP